MTWVVEFLPYFLIANSHNSTSGICETPLFVKNESLEISNNTQILNLIISNCKSSNSSRKFDIENMRVEGIKDNLSGIELLELLKLSSSE